MRMRMTVAMPNKNSVRTFPRQEEMYMDLYDIELQIKRCKICGVKEFRILSMVPNLDQNKEPDATLLHRPSSPRGTIQLNSSSDKAIVFNNWFPSTYKGWGSYPDYALILIKGEKIIKNPINGQIVYGNSFYFVKGEPSSMFLLKEEDVATFYHKGCLKERLRQPYCSDEVYQEVMRRAKWIFNDYFLFDDIIILRTNERHMLLELEDFEKVMRESFVDQPTIQVGCKKFRYIKTRVNRYLLNQEYDQYNYFQLGNIYLAKDNESNETFVGIEV